MERLARHDLAAFEVLYDRHADRLHAWMSQALSATEALDAAQEVLLKVWTGAHLYDPSRGAFTTWLWSIARHQLVRRLRERGLSEQLRAALRLEASLLAAGVAAGEEVLPTSA